MNSKDLLMERIKHSKTLTKLYGSAGKLFLRVLKVFIATDDKLILFNSFGGKKFDDSPRAIYMEMKSDPRFSDFKLVWAFHNPNQFPEVKNSIKTDNIKYFITALRARCWVSNSSIQRGIVFKGKNTFSFNTWHGTPLKYMGYADNPNKVNRIMDSCDVILAQSKYEAETFSDNWNISINKYKIIGLPRNDELAFTDEEKILDIKKRLGIKEDNTVILYAPTFRDYLLDDSSRCTLDVPLDYEYWESIFKGKVTFLMRVHYEVAKHNQLPDNEMWKDVSDYPVLNDLMLISDILISDYSSIMFDYSILGRPIINYLYDYDEYDEKRGLLFDVRKELPWTDDSRKLADMINTLNIEQFSERTKAFREKYVEAYGDASRQSVDIIYDAICKDGKK